MAVVLALTELQIGLCVDRAATSAIVRPTKTRIGAVSPSKTCADTIQLNRVRDVEGDSLQRMHKVIGNRELVSSESRCWQFVAALRK